MLLLIDTDLRLPNNIQLAIAASCLCAVTLINYVFFSSTEGGHSLPPSPPTWRLLGHFLPARNAWLTVGPWIEKYGPLITLRAGSKKFVVIGRYSAAVDIMEKQGASLVDRPRFVAAGEMLTGGLSLPLAPSGERFRRLRKAIHTHLQPTAAEAYQPLQMEYAKKAVIDMLNDPCNFQNAARGYAAATSMKIAYGKTTPTSATDPEVIRIVEGVERLRVALRPGEYMVDSIPALKYLPWYGRNLRDGFRSTRELFTEQLSRIKKQLGAGDSGPSFGRYLLENNSLYGLSELEMAYLSGVFFAAGSDTTTLAICTILMAAACFPEEQRKVHDELDAVIGKNRAPTFADEHSLPRLHAFISEALRWRPLIPMGLPHQTTKEVIWENYSIPAGTAVFGNHWAISRDPEAFPDPDAFKPDRWLDAEGCVRDDVKFFVFGFGRRVCPGQHVANNSVFLNTVLFLWAFRLVLDDTKPLDDMAFMDGGMPDEQPCTIDFKTRIPEAELRRMMAVEGA